MAIYVILSRLSPDSFDDPSDFRKIAAAVSKRIRQECKNVTWKASYATLGHYDVVDIVESDDPDEVARAAMIIRALGHATTDTMPATPWKEFLDKL